MYWYKEVKQVMDNFKKGKIRILDPDDPGQTKEVEISTIYDTLV